MSAVPAFAMLPIVLRDCLTIWPVRGALFGLLLLGGSAPVAWAQPEEAFTPVTVEELRREPAPTATDALAQRFLDTYPVALGGEAAMAAIQTLRRQGSIREGRTAYELTEYIALPGKFRREKRWRAEGRDYLEVTATDGTQAWTQQVSPRQERPLELGAGEVARLSAQADLFGPLVTGPEAGWHFVYRGATSTRTRPGFLVLGASPSGQRLWFYFDAETYLNNRIGSREKFAGQEADSDRYVVRFTRVNGVWFPSEVEYETTNRVYRHERWTRLEANLPLDDALFLPPPSREVILRQRPR